MTHKIKKIKEQLSFLTECRELLYKTHHQHVHIFTNVITQIEILMNSGTLETEAGCHYRNCSTVTKELSDICECFLIKDQLYIIKIYVEEIYNLYRHIIQQITEQDNILDR